MCGKKLFFLKKQRSLEGGGCSTLNVFLQVGKFELSRLWEGGPR